MDGLPEFDASQPFTPSGGQTAPPQQSLPAFDETRPFTPAEAAPPSTAMQTATEFTKGVGRGAVGTLAGAARGAADIGETGYRRLTGRDAPDLGITSTANRAEEATKTALAPAPGYEDSLTSQLGEAVGGFAPYFIPGAGIALGMGSGADLIHRDAISKGATQDQIDIATMGGAAVGYLLKYIPDAGTMLAKFTPEAKNAILAYALRSAQSGVGAGGIAAVVGGLNDAIEKYTYDPAKIIGEGQSVGEVGINMMAGAILHGVVHEPMHALFGKPQEPPPPPPGAEGTSTPNTDALGRIGIRFPGQPDRGGRIVGQTDDGVHVQYDDGSVAVWPPQDLARVRTDAPPLPADVRQPGESTQAMLHANELERQAYDPNTPEEQRAGLLKAAESLRRQYGTPQGATPPPPTPPAPPPAASPPREFRLAGAQVAPRGGAAPVLGVRGRQFEHPVAERPLDEQTGPNEPPVSEVPPTSPVRPGGETVPAVPEGGPGAPVAGGEEGGAGAAADPRFREVVRQPAPGVQRPVPRGDEVRGPPFERRAPPPPETPPEPPKPPEPPPLPAPGSIGKSAEGRDLFEDARGIRHYVEDGVQYTEPVILRPTRSGYEYVTNRFAHPEFETAEERAARTVTADHGTRTKPVEVNAPEDMDLIRRHVDQNPTPEQVKAGNAKKGYGIFQGLRFALETIKGSVRRDMQHDPPQWEVPDFPADYGHLVKYENGADGEGLDAFFGPNPQSKRVFVINQADADTGAFDEHKLMLGFDSRDDAINAYARAFSDGKAPDRLGGIHETTVDGLKDWLKNGDTTKPFEPPAVAPHPEYGTPDAPNVVGLGRRFAAAFAEGRRFASIVEARKFAAQHLGGEVTTPAARKALDEAIEYGVTVRARDIVQQGIAQGILPTAIFDHLLDLYRAQPALNERSADSRLRQAYSTPAPMAYLASVLADITPNKWVFEPTAGNGMLLIGADPSHVIANEIDPTRQATLRETYPAVSGNDAATWTANPGQMDVVIANPPFGPVLDAQGNKIRWRTPKYPTTEIDHAIVFKALESMKDDGTAVLIIGGKKARGQQELKDLYSTQESRAFFKALFDDYNVTDHFQVSGDLYNKQGASWPIDMLVIKGRGKSDRPLPGVAPPRILESFEQLKDLVHDNGRVGTPEDESRPDGGRGPQGRPPGSDDVSGNDAKPRPPNAPEGGQGGGGGGGEDVPAGGGGHLQPPGEPVGGPPHGGGGDDRDTTGGRPPADTPVAPGGNGPKPAGERGPGSGGPGDVAEPRGPAGKRDELDDLLDNLLDDKFKDKAPPPAPPEEPSAPPSAGPKPPPAPRGPRPPSAPKGGGGGEPPAPKPKPPTPEGASETMAEVADELGALFQRPPAEEEPPPRTDLAPGIDSAKYEKAVPSFIKGIKDLGGKDGDDIPSLAKRLIDTLTDVFGYTRERIQAMLPYLKQFLNDIKNGIIRLSQAVSKRGTNLEKETRLQVHYEPGSNAKAIGTLVPVNMQTAITHALDGIRDRVGDVDKFVADKLGFSLDDVLGTKNKDGVFSAEQVDAIAMAIDNHDRGAGMIVGDQTGVGKGRIVAAMMKYAMMQGKVPVFVTKSPGLFADMYRDVRDIGMKDFRALVTNADLRGKKAVPISDSEVIESPPAAQLDLMYRHIEENGRLPRGYDALFTNYSQLQYGDKGSDSARHPMMRALAPNALLIFDESHEAGGSATRKIDRDTGLPIPGRADFVRELLGMSEGGIYSSATYAKNPHVMSLYFKTDMRLAVANMAELTELLHAGKDPLAQVIANMTVEAGQMVRRERSWDGVEMRLNTVKSDMNTAETVSGSLRQIFDFDKGMADVRDIFATLLGQQGGGRAGDNAIGQRGATGVGFSSIMHNVIGQAILSMKAKAAVDEAVESWKRGEKPIIAMSQTFGALLHEYVQEHNHKAGDDLTKLTFNRVFENYLKRTRRMTETDPHSGEKTFHWISDEWLRENGFDHIIDQYNEVAKAIHASDMSKMPSSPIDHMLDTMRAAGMKVGEITGRDWIVKNGILTQRDSTDAAKKRTMNQYNDGQLDALVINRSGSTGFSLHSSVNYRDFDNAGKQIPAKQRHMILLQNDPNIDTFMQMLGRIHRTGQISLPRYQMLMLDLPVEKRPAAVTMRKLGMLNANTSANRESAISLDNVTDFMNQYGDEVVAEILTDDPELADILGVHPGTDSIDGTAAKATGRLAIFPPAEQAAIYDRIERNYKDLIDAQNALGQNALEAKTLELDARTVSQTPISEDLGIDSPFAKPAYLERINVKRIGRPYTMDEARDRIAQVLGIKDRTGLTGKAVDDAMTEMKNDLRERGESYLQDLGSQADSLREQLTALLAHPDIETDAGLKKKREELEGRAHRLDDRIQALSGAGDSLATAIEGMRAGRSISITVGQGANAEVFLGLTLGLARDGTAKNPFAFSNYVARVAIADGSREIKIPLSKIASGKFTIADVPYSQVKDAFDSGQAAGRENRSMVTGNLLAGFRAFSGQGQIVMYTDNEGNVRQGIILPRAMNTDAELERRPVVLNPGQAVRFLDRIAAAGNPGLIKSDDGGLSIQKVGNDYMLRAKTRGGRQFYLNREVNDILGYNQFAQRRGRPEWEARASADKIARILKVYNDNLGTNFHADSYKDHARAILAEDNIQGPATTAMQRPPLDEAAEAAQGEEPASDEQNLARGLVGEKFTANHDALADGVAAIVKKMAPGARAEPMARMRSTAESGKAEEVYGAYYRERLAGGDLAHVIAYSLSGPDPEGAVRHEFVHYARRAGLLDAKEWATLADAADKEGWLEKYRIAKRYGDVGRDVAVEEAVAERFPKWVEERKAGIKSSWLPEALQKLFYKLDLFRRRVAAMARSVMGRAATADDIFSGMESGAVGRRSVTDRLAETARMQRPTSSPSEGAVERADTQYPRAGKEVDGLAVRDKVPNTDSIGASLGNEGDYEELPGIREVPMSEFGGPKSFFYAADDFSRASALAKRIKDSGEINPVIVVIDRQGPYILEGGHRMVALQELGAKSVPALVVVHTADIAEGATQGQPLFQRPGTPEREAEVRLSPLEKITDRLRGALGKVMDMGQELQMKAAPMAVGTAEGRAAAKDFAVRKRLLRHEWQKADDWLRTSFTPDERREMFNAAEEQSLAEQREESTEGIGLARLDPRLRSAVELMQAHSRSAWATALREGMVQGEGIPSYTPHIFVNFVNGMVEAMRSKKPPPTLDMMGKNLTTTTDRLKRRKHETIEEAEANARAGFGEGATVVRDIRALALATRDLNDAVTGRSLVNRVKELTTSSGDPAIINESRRGYVLINHPAFFTLRPKLAVRDELGPRGGRFEPVLDAKTGRPQMERVPIYVREDLEGPLRSVLSQDSGKAYQALMALKSKTMGLIMFSPMIHGAVEWGRALPAMPGKVVTGRIYFEGNAAKNDPTTMREAILAGLAPIGRRGGEQDITSIASGEQVAPGRSWTAQLLGAVPGLFDARAGDAVKRAVDRMGDLWHNTLLWDRVADLQMGLYTNLRDKFIRMGADSMTAQWAAAHFANRYAGALPLEAMSTGARKLSNLMMFSRTFTLGNLGALKDMIVGLPRDVQAKILQSRGADALQNIQSIVRRKAIGVIAVDIGLMYLGNAALQSAIAIMSGDSDLDKEMQGYAQRLGTLMQRAKENPLDLFNPFRDVETLLPQGENEPGKRDRIYVGRANDGTAIYMRNPVGKIGEEFVGWMTGPLDMLKRKLSTIARPTFQVVSNDKGFKRPVYNPYAETPKEWIKNIGNIVWLYMSDQIPMQSIQAAKDFYAGRGDQRVNAAQAVGPLVGATFSKGYPHGQVFGEMANAKARQEYTKQQAMPSIMQKLKDGDVDGAVADMTALGMDQKEQRFRVDSVLSPREVPSRAALKKMYQYTTPEQQERINRTIASP